MRVLVACEFSGIARDAFAARGHDAWSCDLLPTERPGQHIQGDVLEHLHDGWDLMIAHPPCTYLTVTGNRWFLPKYKDRFPDRQQKREEAMRFFMALINAPIPRIAIENPVGFVSRFFRPPDQVIQPFWFGDSARKQTCLWLKRLPRLSHNSPLFVDPKIVSDGGFVLHKSGNRTSNWYASTSRGVSPKERAKIRSKTFPGIAEAMASQWGSWELEETA